MNGADVAEGRALTLMKQNEWMKQRVLTKGTDVTPLTTAGIHRCLIVSLPMKQQLGTERGQVGQEGMGPEKRKGLKVEKNFEVVLWTRAYL